MSSLFTFAVGRSRLHKLLENEIERFRDSDRELFELTWASMNVSGEAGVVVGEAGSALMLSESGSQNWFPISESIDANEINRRVYLTKPVPRIPRPLPVLDSGSSDISTSPRLPIVML